MEREEFDIHELEPNQEMEITHVSRSTPQIYEFILNDRWSIELHKEIYIRYQLFKGSVLTREKLKELLKLHDVQIVYSRAVRMLKYNAKSKKQLKDRLLAQDYKSSTIDIVICRLEKEGWINEEQYARNLAKKRVLSQKKGKGWVKQELVQQGLNSTQIEKALEEITSEKEFELGYQCAFKKWKNLKGEIQERKYKLFSYLARRGYSSTIIQKIYRTLENDSEQT